MVARICIFSLIIISSCSVFKKDYTKGNPPGTVQINDTLYIDQTEMTNIGWQEYLYYLSSVEQNEEKHQKALPDTLVWRNQLRYCEPIVEYYFRHPAYNSYPVVGISYEQAVEYCKWRTYVANFGIYLRENKLEDQKAHLKDNFPIKFYYRLPTKQEWETIAAGSLPVDKLPFGTKDVYFNWKGKQSKMFNCVFPGDISDTSSNYATYTAATKTFFPNSFHAYNMIGNVAEMVSDKGIAKGGSFVDKLDSCKIILDKFYDGPQAWLGFRCVAVKVK